ncbi:MAG: hypothetical protein M3337_02010 [Actinomycetota bacterium]|nr:hypothetical protein [Actinomycetota bacterium]
MSDAFISEFEELFRIAYRSAYAILGDRGDAEDCAQESLARAMVRWRRIEPYGHAWVARVSTNLALDRTRKRKRSVLAGEERDEHARVDDYGERRQELAQALRNLPRRQRERHRCPHEARRPRRRVRVLRR